MIRNGPNRTISTSGGLEILQWVCNVNYFTYLAINLGFRRHI